MQKQKISRTTGAHAAVLRLSLSAVMAAASIVVTRLVLFLIPLSGPYRIDIGFLPIAIVAILAGPLWSAAAYGVADLIGALMTTGMNPLILACKILTGALLGLLLYKKRPGILISAVTMLLVIGVIDVLLMAGVFVQMGYSPSYGAALIERLLNAAINLPLRLPLLYLLGRYGGKILDRFERMLRQ